MAGADGSDAGASWGGRGRTEAGEECGAGVERLCAKGRGRGRGELQGDSRSAGKDIGGCGVPADWVWAGRECRGGDPEIDVCAGGEGWEAGAVGDRRGGELQDLLE